MWQFWVNVIVLFVLGVLGAASLIVKKKPEAKDLIDSLAKISGYIGAVAALWGVWGVIQLLLHLHISFYWLMGLVTCLVMIFLGFIFGWGLTTAYLSDEAKAKGEELRKKLVPFQLILGLVAMGLAIFWVVFTIF